MMKEVQTAVPRSAGLIRPRDEPGRPFWLVLAKGRRTALESLRFGTTPKSFRQTLCWWNRPIGTHSGSSREVLTANDFILPKYYATEL
jgi:hypothetical protein